MSLYSIDGRKIKDFVYSSGEQLDLNDLSNGVYMLRANFEELTFAKIFSKK